MPLPDDRLQELRRQRAYVQEQLAWLDREIASASGETGPAPEATAPEIAPVMPAGQPAAPSAESPDIDALMASYKAETQASASSVRRGCFLAFGAALLLFALCVAAFYYYVSTHPSPPGH
ncbi:MAG: hypothetical protein ABSE59_01635 [Opitutaceae bacterium]|jgi:hypothetical protein